MEPIEAACVGGPLAQRVVISRFPKGFLLVDKPTNRCWIYDLANDLFVVRDENPMEVITEKRHRTAMESDYDVLAMPYVGVEDDY